MVRMEMRSTLQPFEFAAPAGRRLAVLGDPIGHSLSPAMHNAALRQMAGRDPELSGWHYHAIRVPAAELEPALQWLHAQEVCGINLTLPHKVEALRFVEAVDHLAERMGAVNTLIRTPSGYRGTNTDGYGIAEALKESFGTGFAGRDVWIFGAGGAARGISVQALASGCRRLTVVNRTSDRLERLCGDLQAGGASAECRFLTTAAVTADADPRALLINATSLGLREGDAIPIPPSFLSAGRDVYDTTYGFSNALRHACGEVGCHYADGLSMLVWQGARSLEIWTGKPVPVETMREAALRALSERDRA